MSQSWWKRACPWASGPDDEDAIERTFDMEECSDCFPTLAAIAPLLDRPTHITGLAHTRLQECNRPTAMARNLKRLGVWVTETRGSLTVYPFGTRPSKP